MKRTVLMIATIAFLFSSYVDASDKRQDTLRLATKIMTSEWCIDGCYVQVSYSVNEDNIEKAMVDINANEIAVVYPEAVQTLVTPDGDRPYLGWSFVRESTPVYGLKVELYSNGSYAIGSASNLNQVGEPFTSDIISLFNK